MCHWNGNCITVFFSRYCAAKAIFYRFVVAESFFERDPIYCVYLFVWTFLLRAWRWMNFFVVANFVIKCEFRRSEANNNNHRYECRYNVGHDGEVTELKRTFLAFNSTGVYWKQLYPAFLAICSSSIDSMQLELILHRSRPFAWLRATFT